MRITNGFPVCVGHGQHGIWRVTAHLTDGRIHSKDYEAFTMAQAKRSYLMEFGPIRGEVHAELVKKLLDKSAKV